MLQKIERGREHFFFSRCEILLMLFIAVVSRWNFTSFAASALETAQWGDPWLWVGDAINFCAIPFTVHRVFVFMISGLSVMIAITVSSHFPGNRRNDVYPKCQNLRTEVYAKPMSRYPNSQMADIKGISKTTLNQAPLIQIQIQKIQ